jgi:hypothetical protein
MLYLVGTPKGRLSRLEQALLAQLGGTLPEQPPPRITAKRAVEM